MAYKPLPDFKILFRGRHMRNGEAASLSSCALALATTEGAELGDLVPGLTNVTDVEIASALVGLERLPMLTCACVLNGVAGWLTAFAEERFAFEVAYCNDTQRKEAIAQRVEDRHKPVEITFTRVVFRRHRRGRNLPVRSSLPAYMHHPAVKRARARITRDRLKAFTEAEVRYIVQETALEIGHTENEELRQLETYLVQAHRSALIRKRAKDSGTYVPRRQGPRRTEGRGWK